MVANKVRDKSGKRKFSLKNAAATNLTAEAWRSVIIKAYPIPVNSACASLRLFLSVQALAARRPRVSGGFCRCVLRTFGGDRRDVAYGFAPSAATNLTAEARRRSISMAYPIPVNSASASLRLFLSVQALAACRPRTWATLSDRRRLLPMRAAHFRRYRRRCRHLKKSAEIYPAADLR